MEIWYKQRWNKITKVKVTRSTNHFIFNTLPERREAKSTDYYSYHKKWKEAKEELIKRREKEINDKKFILNYLENSLKKIKELKKEDVCWEN